MIAPTAGNWRVNSTIEDAAGCIVEADSGRMICECYEDGEVQTDEDRANAKAIAALPDMLAALKAVAAETTDYVRPSSSDSYLPPDIASMVRAAIVKAGA